MKLTFDKQNKLKIENFTILKKSEHIFHINDGTPSFVTFVIGKKNALLVDTSWGIENLRNFIEEVFAIPYKVVNTHGHPDHCFGNFQFDEVLVPEKDVDVYSEIKNFSKNRDAYIKDEKKTLSPEKMRFPKLKTISEGETFDLGEITVTSVPLYSHTHGSLGYLINEEKILLSGDAINTNVWLFMKESLSLEDCLKTYEKAKHFEFEKILGSHGKVFWKKEILDSLLLNLKQVLSSNYEFTDENYEEIMGYHTNAAFASYGNSACFIRIPDRRFYK